MDKRRDLVILDSTFLTTTDAIQKYVPKAISGAKRVDISSDHGKVRALYASGNFKTIWFLTHTNPMYSPMWGSLSTFANKAGTRLVWGYRAAGLVKADLFATVQADSDSKGWQMFTNKFGYPDADEFFNPFVFIWTNPMDSVEWHKKVRAEAMRTGEKLNIEE